MDFHIMRFAVIMRANIFLASLSIFALCASLTGCTLTNTAAPASQSVLLQGSVYGGSVPVVGAHVYLYAANTTALAGPAIAATSANSSVSLLKAAANTAADINGNYYVVTGSDGSFSISGDFNTCTPGEQLYIYSSGGNASGSNNASAGLMAVIGGCTATYPNSSTRVHVNEMSTVAAAYALAGFASDATHISDDEAVQTNTTAAYAQTGMANAFANAANLVTLATGAALSTTPGGNGAVPTTTLNTIASLLAACVQSAGITNPACSELFAFTGTPATSDTATAAIKLAQNPAGVSGSGITVATLINSLTQSTAFAPVLTAPPNDFSIAIAFSGTQIVGPNAIAIDSQGSPWIADNGSNYISKLSGSGAVYTETDYTDTSLAQPLTLALDSNNSVWVASNNGNFATEFIGSGTSYTAHAYSGGDLNLPYAIAVDGNNNIFIPDLVPSGVTEFYGSGTTYNATQYTGNNLPYSIAIDANGDLWTGSLLGGTVTEFVNASGTYTAAQYTDATLSGGFGVAIDASGSAWFAGNASNTLTRFAGAGALYTSTSFTGGGLNAPVAVAVDGSGSLWLANSSGQSISEFSNLGVPLSPSTGYTGSTAVTGTTSDPLAGPTDIAIDGSGNVWVSDSSNTAVEFVGAATPVIVPLASAVHYNKLGVQP